MKKLPAAISPAKSYYISLKVGAVVPFGAAAQ